MMGFAGRVALAGSREREVKLTGTRPDGQAIVITVPQRAESFQVSRLASLSFPSRGVAMISIHNSLGAPELNAHFDQLMKQVKDARAKALILNLMYTPSGGDSVVAKPLMAWFVDGARGYQRHERGGQSWIEQVEGRKDRYEGRLIVAVSRWTGSMGEGTAIGLRAAAGAEIIGTRMAGLRGAIGSFDVPCFGTSLRLPVERLSEVDGRPRELAMPDAFVTEEELAANPDMILKRAGLMGYLTDD
jgi:carboxyl-terminal processing protease